MLDRIHQHTISKIAYFSHWTRKSYAAFNSLNKVIKISCLALAMLNISFVPDVMAQTSDTASLQITDVELNEIEVVATKSALVYNEQARIVTVISRQQILASPASSINELLQSIVSLDVKQRGAYDIQADVNSRSGTFDQTLILLNGIAVSDPQTGHHNLDLPITLDQIERIEILSGPGSRVLGPNAYSGAINIVTRQSTNSCVELNGAAGDFGYFKTSASLVFVTKRISNFLSVQKSASSGYKYNTDFAQSSLFWHMKFTVKKSISQMQLGLSDKAFGANSFYSPKYLNQFEKTKTGFASYSLHRSGVINTKIAGYYRIHSDRFELFRSFTNAPAWYKNHNFHFSQVAGFNVLFFKNWRKSKSSFGYDYKYEDIHSNVLGIKTNDTLLSFIMPDGFFTKFDKRTSSSFFAEHSIEIKRFRIATGVMCFIDHGSKNHGFFPGVDVSFQQNNALSYFASFNTTMRLPTFTDLYYQGPTNIGNPALVAETSSKYEIGIKSNHNSWSANGLLYFGMSKNSIDWVRATSTEKWQPQNLTDLNSYGLEYSFVCYPNRFKKQFLKAIDRFAFGGSINRLSRLSATLQSNYSMDYLRYKFGFQLEHKLWRMISLTWNVRWQDRNGSFMEYDFTNQKEFLKEYNPFGIIDVKIQYKGRNLNAYLSLHNLLNTQYFDFGNIPQAGRVFSLGCSYTIDFKNIKSN